MAENSNKIIGDYELIALLGDGAQGRVFKARAISGAAKVPEGTTVAIKVLSRASADPKEDARFKRQADILSRLSHPSVCRYVDYFIWQEGEFDELKCLVMEFLDGEPLSERVARFRKGVPWEEVHAIFKSCIEALIHASQHGVVHRDLKPSNIFITRSGLAKVIDFGIARRQGGDETSTGGWKGSFDFMAPDFVNIEGFGGDEISDVFSLCVCFFQALTGELPFPPLGQNAHIGYLNRWKGEPPQISFASDKFRVLLNCRSMVRKGLQVAREERYATFAALLEDLEKIRYRVVRHHGKEDYELIDVLGRGGFGEVYLGRCASNGRLVAVKHLFAGRQSSRFIKEARLLQEYKHPDIVEYVDFIEIEGMGEDKEYFLVMEYLPGMPEADLRRRIRNARNGLDVGEVLELFWHYLRALQYLHENPRPIIHRDIKPGNLYAPIGHPEKAKIFDLGVARDVSGTLTTGMIPGTLDYMAPEFARPGAERGSPQSDLYALGVAMYEALTGTKPLPKLPKEDQDAFVQFVARAQNPPPVPFNAPVFSMWPRLKQILRMALASDPKDRYGSAAEMLREVEGLLREVAEVAADETEAPTRATQVNPELLTRIKKASEQKIAQLPTAAFQGTEQETGFRPSAGELDLDEEGAAAFAPPPVPVQAGTPSPSDASRPRRRTPTAQQTAPAPEPTPAPPPKPKQSWSSLAMKALGALVVLALAGYGAYTVLRGVPAGVARKELGDYVQANAVPAATGEYMARYQEVLQKANEWHKKDLTHRPFWDDRLADLRSIAGQLPLAFSKAFAEAEKVYDVERAQTLLKDWTDLEPNLESLGMDSAAYTQQRDTMRTKVDRLQFLANVNFMDRTLPDPITTAENVQAAERVARAYRESLDREWKGVTKEEVDAAHKRVREALARNGTEYITQMRNFAVNRYESLVSGDVQWENLRAMAVNAPTLVGLIGEPYETAVADVQRAKAVKEGKAGYVAMVKRMDETLPATVTTTGQVAQLAATAALLAEFTGTEWQGIEPGAFEKDRQRLTDAVTQRAQAYVQQITAAATEKLGRLETADEEWAALQALGQQTALVARVQSEYDQSLRNVGALRTEQENKQAFVASANAIRRQIPKAMTTPEEIAAAEQAAVAYEAFATRDWTGINPAELDKIRKDLRTLLADPFTAYVRGLKDRALERYGRLEDASEEWQQLSTLSERAPKLVGLVETDYRAAVQDVGRARGDKEIYAEFTLARNEVSGAMPAAIQDSATLKKAEEAAVKFEAFAARTFEGIPAEEQEQARRELRARLTELGDRYVEGLKTAALERFSRMEDADAQWRQLAAIRSEAPVFSKIIQRNYAQAVRAVSTARDNRQNLAAYMAARSAVADGLPASIAAPADLDRAEKAALAYPAFAERAWAGVDAQEQAQEKEKLRAALTTLSTNYIAGLKQQAMARLDAMQDAQEQLDALRSLKQRAPSLVALVGADYDDTLRNLELAQRKKEGISEFTTALEKVYELLRGDLDSPAQLLRKESALKAFEEMKAQPWESVSAEERTKAFTEIDSALTRAISTYVGGLKTTILSRIASMEDVSGQIAALREIETKAPGLAARISNEYRQALTEVDRAARDIELLAAFQKAISEVDRSLPKALQTQEDLAAAESAAKAFKTVSTATWEGVPKDRLDKALADRRTALVDLASSRTAQLRAEAVGLYAKLENGDAAWSALQEVELRAPSLVELITQEFHDALAETNDARKRKIGITEFRDTVAKIDQSIPAVIDGPTQLTHAEQAATALRQAAQRDWDGVPAAEKSAALRPLEEKLSDRVARRIDQLADDAQGKFDAMQDGEASWQELESLAKKAPTLVQARSEAYTAAVQRVQSSRDRKVGQSEFRAALAAVRQAAPAAVQSPKDLVPAEKATVLYQTAAEAAWPAVAAADRRSGLEAERGHLERLVRGYVDRLKTEAETLYGRGESGDAQLAELEALPTKAPKFAELAAESQAAAVTALRRQRDRMGALSAFRTEVARVSGMVPAAITDKAGLAQAEKAVSAYQDLAAREWPEIPSSEKTDALGTIRSALVAGVTAYMEGISGRAVEQYGAMQNADALLEELTAISRDAPNLVGMVFNAYERAVARVRGARDQMRTAALEKTEADAFARVQQAWNTVQASWKTGTITGMKEAYQAILGASFELPKFAEPYAAIRKEFSEGLQSRLGQVLGQAEGAIADYLAFLFQVDDPSLSGSYRAISGTAPKVSFELPPIADLRELKLGIPYLGLVRLEAWSRASAGLGTDRSRRALAATLKELAAECVKQGLADQAAICEFQRAALESQPQVFPREVADLAQPVDILRWRAHANYQPEVSAKEVLSDLSRFAAGGGTLNEYDVRLAFFAAYYSWRNAIDGEQKYAQEIRAYLKQIVEAAPKDVADAAVDFLIGIAESAYDDEEEFPGLYMLRAVSRMPSEASIVKSARQWMAGDGAGQPYSNHLAVIKQQVDLLDRLLK